VGGAGYWQRGHRICASAPSASCGTAKYECAARTNGQNGQTTPPGQNGQNTPPAPDGQNGQTTPPEQSGGFGSSTPSGQSGQLATDAGVSHDHGTAYPQSKSSATISTGISVVVRLDTDFNSDNATVGQVLPATVVTPVTSEGNVVVPRGANAHYRLSASTRWQDLPANRTCSWPWSGSGPTVKLRRASHFGSTKSVDGPSQGVRTAERTGIGSAAGAAIGALTGNFFIMPHRAGLQGRRPEPVGATGLHLTSHPAPG